MALFCIAIIRDSVVFFKYSFRNHAPYYYIISCEFFTSELVGGLSLESEWQQVFFGLQDSSEYSWRC